MRLIDADDLITQMESDAEQMESMAFKFATYAAINEARHAPTVEPERKTGHWIEHYGDSKCSECGYELKIYDTNYCPNCGARMDGGSE